MEQELKDMIYQKIDELKELAAATDSAMLLMFKENNVENGRHVAAYGSGKQIKELIISCLEHEPNLIIIFKAVRDEAFPSPLPQSIQEALNSGDGVYRP